MKQEQRLSSKLINFILHNKFVIFLLILLLVGLNIFVFSKISYIFQPLKVLITTVSLPIILAGVAYYLLNPIVDILERFKVKRIYSILLLYLIIIGLITFLIVAIIPFIKEQTLSLIENFPKYYNEAMATFEKWIGSDIFNHFQRESGIDFNQMIRDLTGKAAAFFNNTLSGIGSIVGKVTEVVLAIVIVPFVLFYLLKDGKKLPDYMVKFLPNKLRNGTQHVMSEMNRQISTYIRAQIIDSFCIGILLYIGYMIIGLEYSLVLAIIAAFTSVVPYLGPTIAITPALIVALFMSPVMLLKMIVVWTVVQFIEGKFISPQIMGKTLKIHPITVIFVILTAGNLFGIIGVILAVPGYAVLKVIATHLFQWFKMRSGLYDREGEHEMN
ncbi:AI-2E family transporter [Paenibacillus sp. 1001270B_150601_E10]|uniref:AI-2E family transporter n=1 Tax=Paenibacillus sp. 1001270B_150601_E10 TaxID=2787079 RepID=UPI00189CFCB1|nr:AI-2E family transporter [Paenibacillus sp. 1001270B_150601_E10]